MSGADPWAEFQPYQRSQAANPGPLTFDVKPRTSPDPWAEFKPYVPQATPDLRTALTQRAADPAFVAGMQERAGPPPQLPSQGRSAALGTVQGLTFNLADEGAAALNAA